MELRNLRALVEVVRQGGFSRAARTLFSTQSTVSKMVRQLEEDEINGILHNAHEYQCLAALYKDQCEEMA